MNFAIWEHMTEIHAYWYHYVILNRKLCQHYASSQLNISVWRNLEKKYIISRYAEYLLLFIYDLFQTKITALAQTDRRL